MVKYLSASPAFGGGEETDYIPAASCESFLDIKEGDVFDLGGVIIGIFACPGHTFGSVVMLLREDLGLRCFSCSDVYFLK